MKNKEIVSRQVYWTSEDIRKRARPFRSPVDALTGEYLTGIMKITTRTSSGIKYNALDEKTFQADLMKRTRAGAFLRILPAFQAARP